MPKSIRTTRKIANDLICHVANVRAARSAHSMADGIHFFYLFSFFFFLGGGGVVIATLLLLDFFFFIFLLTLYTALIYNTTLVRLLTQFTTIIQLQITNNYRDNYLQR